MMPALHSQCQPVVARLAGLRRWRRIALHHDLRAGVI